MASPNGPLHLPSAHSEALSSHVLKRKLALLITDRPTMPFIQQHYWYLKQQRQNKQNYIIGGENFEHLLLKIKQVSIQGK